MRERVRFFALALLLSACGAGQHQADTAPESDARVAVNHLVFGLPIFGAHEDASSVKPLEEYLSRTFGVRVEVRLAEPYQALPVLLRSGAVDVAELPPLAYVRLHDQDPDVQPIATVVISGNPTYLGHLFVRSDSKYHSLADLQGARIGYVDPESTSGYLFPRDMLRRKGYDPDAFFSGSSFLGKHPLVLDAVRNGIIDVGAAEDVTSEWLGPTVTPAGLRVIAKTERIPNDCVAARPGLDSQTKAAILRALLDLHPPVPDAAKIMTSIGVNGWIAADETRYDRVRLVLAHENHSRKK